MLIFTNRNAKQLKNMEKQQFEIGQVYGNDLHIEIISRTEKTITIKTQAWGCEARKSSRMERNVRMHPF